MRRITIERQARGWSQSRLAREAGLHASTVSSVENGRLRPWPGQAEKLRAALGYDGPADELFEEVGEDA